MPDTREHGPQVVGDARVERTAAALQHQQVQGPRGWIG